MLSYQGNQYSVDSCSVGTPITSLKLVLSAKWTRSLVKTFTPLVLTTLTGPSINPAYCGVTRPPGGML